MSTSTGDPTDRLRRFCNIAVYVLGVALSLLVIYYAISLFVVRDRQANLVLGLSLALYYVVRARVALGGEAGPMTGGSAESAERSPPVPRGRAFVSRSRRLLSESTVRSVEVGTSRVRTWVSAASPAWYLALAVVSLVATGHIELNFERIAYEGVISGFTQLDFVAAALVILLCLDVTRLAFGNILSGLIAVSIGYALYGPYLPGLLYHTGMSVEEVVRVGALSMGGIYGFILEVGATWIAVFLLLAGFAKAYGILDWVVVASQELGKLARSGIVHIAIVASMGMGMITGSGAANTATTGSFTIPMMKEQGVDGEYAGAIEAVASIGGQLVPPIMGIAAFIMADLVGVPYVEVIRAGLIPAFLFYLAIVVSVQVIVFKHGWTSTKSGDLDPGAFVDGVYYVVPLFVLVYTLVVLRYTPLTAGLYTVLSTIGVFVLKRVYEDRTEGVTDAGRRTIEGLRQGAVDMAPLMAILASIGIAIAMFVRTGFAQKLSTTMIGLSGENLFLLLGLAMLVSLIFGMGMPAPAAYILTASLAATAMTRIGVQPLAANMFVFYFAMYASMTPPVGPSTVVAANIAQADFVQTAKRAMQIALPGFLIPYAFIVNQELIYWAWPATPIMLAIAVVSIVGICLGMFRFDGRRPLSYPLTAVYAALALVGLFGSLLEFDPLAASLPYGLQLGATALLAVLMALHYQRGFGISGVGDGRTARED